MITLYDAFFRGLKLFSRMVDKSRRYTSHYRFIDRSSGNENLLIIVAGYQQYLWEKVFDRISEYSDYDLDICVVVPGKDDNELKQICEGNNWSYLCTKENKLALAQNMAIKLHPSAEWIYKLDEDMFIGRGYFQGLKETYRKADVDGRYRVGVVSPLINVNGACYRWYLEKKGLVEEYEEKFGMARTTCDVDPIYAEGEAAVFMWKATLPIDKTIEEFAKEEVGYFSVPIRLSIGAFLMKRSLWEEMGGFKVAAAGQLAWEEMCLCEYCVNWSYTIIVATNVFVGHFGFGKQKQTMKEYYKDNSEMF